MDWQQPIFALVLAATALFLVSQRAGPRWRRQTQIAAIAIYGAAIAVALYAAARWLLG